MYAHAGTETFFHRSKKTSSKFCVGYILYIVVIASRKNDLQEKLCFVQHKKIVAFKSKQRYNKTAINSKHLLQISSILSLNFNKVYDKHRNIKTLQKYVVLEMKMFSIRLILWFIIKSIVSILMVVYMRLYKFFYYRWKLMETI